VLGWLLLKGRCRYCKTRISSRYPIVEGVTAILFVVVFWIFKFSLLTLGYWAFCSWLLALSLIDLDTMTLPNPLTQSGLVLGILFHIVLGFGSEASLSGLAKQVMTGVVGAVLGLWLFDAIAILGYFVLRKDGMGGGDVKLAAMMGAWLGWRYLLLAIFIAAVAGVLVARKTFGKKKPIPFGPFLALGAVVSLFYGKAILSTYLHLMFS
jgi:leader peptidase (prepilin peptidase)/N-methyltransferase